MAAPGANYFRIYIASAPFTLTIYCSVGFYRGIQNTIVPMVMAFAITAMQLTLDYGLIYGRFGLPALGLTGAAVAAWCAQLGGAIVYSGLFFYSPQTANYRANPWRVTSAGLRPLFRIGQDLATGTAARMGAATLSAYEIVFQLFMLCSDIIDGLAIAGQALVAKYLGSGERERAYRMGVTLTLCGVTAGLLFAVSFALAWAMIVEFFTANAEIIALLSPGVTILVCLIQPLNGVVFVLDGLLIGARDTRYLMWAMVAGAAIMIPLAWSARQFDLGLPGILLAIVALMIWRAATNVSRFVNQAWQRGR